MFSELPTSGLLADLLAYCFPSSLSGDSTNIEAKMKRLLSRLRSVEDEEGSLPQALSVRYQTNSQVTSSHLQKSFGEDLGKFCELVQSGAVTEDSGYLLHTNALEVGNVLYEFDSGYLEFLDTLFSVIVPEKTEVSLSFPVSASGDSSLLTISQLQQSSANKDGDHSSVPYLSEFLSKLKEVKLKGVPWQCVLPLLNALHTWSQTACPQVNFKDFHKPKKRKSSSMKSKTDEVKGNTLKTTTLRVTLPPELVISCLKQREQLENRALSLSHLKDPRSETSLSNTRKKRNRSLHIEDFDSNDKTLTEQTHLPNSFGGKVGTTSTLQTTPLMRIPDGVLKVSSLVYFYLELSLYIPTV